MNARLIWAILSTLLEEAAMVALVRIGLPEFGIELPLGVLIAVMVAWATVAVIFYRMGSRALRRKPLVGLLTMVGGNGKVVSPLDPEGVIRISGELWRARSVIQKIDVGEEVIVKDQDGTKLIVVKSDLSGLEESR
jgi:membrane-bound serine protease (ClpP class)|tara:strand:+ start:524 stop:931 length:408 start_codon:yes stop_codon:yes gene_type:complete